MLKFLLMTGAAMPFCMEEAGGEGADAGAGGGDKPTDEGNQGQGQGDGGDGGQNGGEGTQGGEGDAPKIYRPDGLPDHFAGENDNETIDKLFKAVEGYRKKQGEGAPKTADEYAFEEPEDFKGKLLRPGEDGKDPILEKFKPIAHKHGLSNEAFQDMALEFSKSLMELGDGDGGEDGGNGDAADFEYESYGGADAAKPVVDGVTTWAQGLKTQGKLTDADIEEINLMSMHSQGLGVLSKLRELTGEKPIPKGEGAASANKEVTQEMLNERVADPRYRSGSKEFDLAFYEETVEMFKKVYN